MKTILLLRGLSRQQAHWGNFPMVLSQAFSEPDEPVQLVYEDLPGFGQRFQEKSPASIEGIAQLLAFNLRKLYDKSGQKVHLIGISMGGLVALELVRRYPHYCQSLVMINSSAKPVSRFYQRLQPSAYSAFIKAWFHPLMRESERQILKLSSEFYADDEALLDYWLQLRKKFPPSRKAAFKQIIAAAKYSVPAEKPAAQLCLIASKKDRIAHYRCTQNLANYWNVGSSLHPNAGHDLALDDPEWLALTIVEFLAQFP